MLVLLILCGRNVNITKCITQLPENGYGANVTAWPARLDSPPDRLFSIKMDAELSRREIYRAESKFWSSIIKGYIGAFRWETLNLRNVLDMRAVYGGYVLFKRIESIIYSFHLCCAPTSKAFSVRKKCEAAVLLTVEMFW